MSVPAALTVGLGELPHMTVREGAGDRGQAGDGDGGGAPDPLVGPAGRGLGGLRGGGGAAHRAALRVRDLLRRTGSGSPSIRMWFAGCCVRPTGALIRAYLELDGSAGEPACNLGVGRSVDAGDWWLRRSASVMISSARQGAQYF
jgi:hypothetical protein